MARTSKHNPSKHEQPVEDEEHFAEEEGYSSPSILDTGEGGHIESDLDAGSDEDSSVRHSGNSTRLLLLIQLIVIRRGIRRGIRRRRGSPEDNRPNVVWNTSESTKRAH